MVRADLLPSSASQGLIRFIAAVVELFYVVLVKRRPQDLLNITKFADDTFSRFWLMMGMQPLLISL